MNKRTQKFFTKLINKSILILKNYGFSTKGISDKWHTFDDLYYHRMVLTQCFSETLPKEYSWKSKLHEDGTMFEDDFIIGFSRPDIGNYSYHYNMKYWDLFDVKELEHAPKYDGHTPDDIWKLVFISKNYYPDKGDKGD